jgi:hypothetical protein
VTRTGISFSSPPWHVNGVSRLEQIRIVQVYQRVLEFAENRMQLLHRANDEGSKMRWDDDLIFCPESKIGGLMMLCRVEVHAKPGLPCAQSAGG